MIEEASMPEKLPAHLPAQRLDQRHPYRALGLPRCLPSVSVVYRIYDADRQPLYIGQSGAFKLRLDDHRRYSPWWADGAYIAVSLYAGRKGAIEPERAAIDHERPRFNRLVLPPLRPAEAPPEPWDEFAQAQR